MHFKRCISYIFLILLLIVFASCSIAEDSLQLFPAKEGWLYGYIHKDGSWAIPPEQFTKAYPFQESGLAPVRTELVNLWFNKEPFKMIDMEGNVVVFLEDWALDMAYLGQNYNVQTPIFSGNANILTNRNVSLRSGLYMSNTGQLIELTPEWLGLPSSPDSNATADNLGGIPNYFPYCFFVNQWQDKYLLSFTYEDRNNDYIHAFVILDQNGYKIHDGVFERILSAIDFCPEPITEPYCEIIQEDGLAYITPDAEIVVSGLPEDSWLTNACDAVFISDSDEYFLLETGETTDALGYALYRAAKNPCGLAVYGNGYINSRGEIMEWPILSVNEDNIPYEYNNEGVAWLDTFSDGFFLIDTEGNPITEEPVYDNYGIETFAAEKSHCFSEGWEVITRREKNGHAPYMNYVNMNGDFLFQRDCLFEAYSFSGGLARVVVLTKDWTPVEAYIDTEGNVIWAENGRQAELQHLLHSEEKVSLANHTTESITQMIAGEWEAFNTCNESAGPMQLKTDSGTDNADVFWRVEIDDSPENEYDFVLVFEWKDGTAYRYGIRFVSANELIIYNDYCCDETYLRVAPGYVESLEN